MPIKPDISVTEIFPMKRELKGFARRRNRSRWESVTEIFPMKRELKVDILRHRPHILIRGNRDLPDEEGTERKFFRLLLEPVERRNRDLPDEEGTERSLLRPLAEESSE